MLVIDEIGKTYSGTGMDTNVIGYRGVREYEDLFQDGRAQLPFDPGPG